MPVYTSPRRQVNMGNIHFKTGQYNKAIKYYRMALDQVGPPLDGQLQSAKTGSTRPEQYFRWCLADPVQTELLFNLIVIVTD